MATFTSSLKTRVDELQAKTGHNRETPEMKPVLGEDRGILAGFAGIKVSQLAVGSVRSCSAFVSSFLQRVIEIETAGKSGGIV